MSEYNRVADLMDEYYMALQRYNRCLGTFEMSASMLAEAKRREAENWSKVHKLKTQLLALGVHV